MGVTIVDIAKRLGISDSTVSRVLNNKKDTFISDATRNKVIAAAREMGYRPNKLACALVTGRSKTIAFWVSGTRTHYYTEVMYHLQDRLREDGYDLVTDSTRSSNRWNWQSPSLQWPFDGVIVCDPPFSQEEFIQENNHRKLPWVSLGVFYWKNGDHVGIDLAAGTTKALEHLLDFGPRVAFVAPSFHSTSNDPRYYAYQAFVTKRRLEPEIIKIPDFQRSNARTAIRNYVKYHGCPNGVFCFNDNVAIGVHRGLRDLNKKMPRDVALVGCDGIEDTEYHDPPISTIDMDLDTMCNRAWEFLNNRINDPDLPPQQLILQPRLIVRESSTLK